MSTLLVKIKHSYHGAATVLQHAGFVSDSDIQSLNRADLNELFPGVENLRLRREIFDIIHKKNVLQKEPEGPFLNELLRSMAPTNRELLADYIHVLKDAKTQMENVLCCMNAHIDHLEDIWKNQADPQPDNDSLAGASDSDICHPLAPSNQEAQVKYQMIVSGKTFDAHLQLMEQVKGQYKGQDKVQFTESSQDCKIVIVFCPVVSRIGSDVEAAMTCVKDDKPVILVLMHHTRDPKCTTSRRTWTDGTHVVSQVNVFYHETKNGLLKCEQNDAAASEIRKELLKHCGVSASPGAELAPNSGGLFRMPTSVSSWFPNLTINHKS
ncbi:uncharacterized protein si:ch211-245h14.1 [Toxotes jaculatrix]|uniref:uncharacterized protein si:ch211-245h14.1 n=1 Tax=Toxotes jaculatrix TaxID=941984 RepID=UPI001B3AA62B|nr:uncharacterized protein si:ch211-245h14.1 [Toxotes jaculatrix]